MQSDGLNSALSPVVYGDIAPSINKIQYKLLTLYHILPHRIHRKVETHLNRIPALSSRPLVVLPMPGLHHFPAESPP